jgi:uncharacterized membrane protein YgcG
MRRPFWIALFCILLTASPALAEEVIRNFVSDVTVSPDGSLIVHETVAIVSEGRQIKRGIKRDFPTDYKDEQGNRVRVGFEVLDVTRDGGSEKFAVESISNGKSIKIGRAEVFLDLGLHTYKITYRTTRQLGFFEKYDELYWNVTGNGWPFPIDSASTIIRLPEGARIAQSAIYTGYQGAKDQFAEVTRADGNIFMAQTTRKLQAGQGLTVAVGWQKGIVTPPTALEQRGDWLRDNLGFFGLALTVLLVPFYYLWAWLKVGRDPPKGTIVPLFHPPEGMGPAGVRYVYKNGYDDKTFASALVGLAVKGKLDITDDNGDFTIEKKAGGNKPLTRSETALYNALPAMHLALQQSNNSSVRALRDRLNGALDDEYDGTMFLKNFKWFFIGFAISAIGLVISGILMPGPDSAFMLVAGGFSTVWWGVILWVGVAAVRGAFGSSGIFSKIKSLMGMIFLIPFVGAGILIPASAWSVTDMSPAVFWIVVSAVTIALFNLIFYQLLKAPTIKGRAILDQIEGFRLFLTTAEEERLKILHPPEKTPELFERYLPYAMALDCENEWNTKFAAVLAAAAATGAAVGTVGGWYHGSGSFGSRNFSENLGSSLASSISSSSVAPGSSSGSFGGGSSGGGGGGGGGSGW